MRSLLLHALFLLGAVALASWVWVERWTPRGDAPVLLDAEIDDLATIVYRWPEGETRVVREGAGKARVYVVTLSRRYDPQAEQRRMAAMSDPKARMAMKAGKDPKEIEAEAVAAGPAGELVTETRTFPPGLFSIAAIQKLTPFRARRSLGTVEAAQLPAMGLDRPTRSLEIVAGRRSVTLDVGTETYGGLAHYARVRGQNEVFLVEAETVRSLETTPRNMMDSRIVTVPPADVERLRLELDGRHAEFIHRNKDQFRARFYAHPDRPDLKVEAVEGLMSTFVGLKAEVFLDAAPAGETLALIRLLRDEGGPHDVRVLRNGDGSGYTIVSGRWIAALAEADARKILEEVRASLQAAGS